MDRELAVVQKAKISITFKMNPEAYAALKIPYFANIHMSGAVESDFVWATQPAEVSVLMYPRHFLEKDGFICVKFLEELRTKHKQMWGIFGPPKDWADQRCHLLFESRYAEPGYNLQVTDWEIKEWIKKTTSL